MACLLDVDLRAISRSNLGRNILVLDDSLDRAIEALGWRG
jgi:hypothetical protein